MKKLILCLLFVCATTLVSAGSFEKILFLKDYSHKAIIIFLSENEKEIKVIKTINNTALKQLVVEGTFLSIKNNLNFFCLTFKDFVLYSIVVDLSQEVKQSYITLLTSILGNPVRIILDKYTKVYPVSRNNYELVSLEWLMYPNKKYYFTKVKMDFGNKVILTLFK